LRVVLLALEVYGGEGGVQRYCRRLVRSLTEDGAVVTVMALWDRADVAGVPSNVRFLGLARSKWRMILHFLRALLVTRPHVILYTHALFAPLMLPARLLRRTARQVLFVYGIEVWSDPGWLWRWPVRSCADRIVSISRYTMQRMSSVYGTTPSRVRLLPPAIDPAPASAADGSLQGAQRLVSVARLDPRDRGKNVDKVIDAMPDLLREFPDLHYYVIGDGHWRPTLEDQARERGVAGRVHFMGWLTDERKARLYAGCHLFVLPSIHEGFGIVFLEAWQHGLPVVTSDQGAAPDVVRHGVDGCCVPPEPAAIARAVSGILGDEERRRAMGRAGREHVITTYGHEDFRAALRGILQECGPCAD